MIFLWTFSTLSFSRLGRKKTLILQVRLKGSIGTCHLKDFKTKPFSWGLVQSQPISAFSLRPGGLLIPPPLFHHPPPLQNHHCHLEKLLPLLNGNIYIFYFWFAQFLPSVYMSNTLRTHLTQSN